MVDQIERKHGKGVFFLGAASITQFISISRSFRSGTKWLLNLQLLIQRRKS